MAWTDSCKIEACNQINKRKEKMSVRQALGVLAKESGIPYGTLRRWYYPDAHKPKSVPKNENTPLETCAISDLQRLIEANKKFGAIYADPPWNYSNQSTRAATNNHYDTLTVDEICQYPISELTADNCHLHLWTTNAFIFETPKILKAWGFVYKSIFVWVKPQMGIGNYWRVSHELLITAIKPGSTTFLDKSQMSWFQADRTKHSRKPETVAQIIEKVSPGPYLELFGRQTRKNWTVWGNEIERDLFNKAAFSARA